MGAIYRLENVLPFAVPVPEHLLDRVTAWFERNSGREGGMVLEPGEARFADAGLADAFAEEIGALWIVHD